jgi:hypothetical protein
MFELITIGSWLFWVALFIVSCFIWYAESEDSRGWAVTLTLALFIIFGYTSLPELKQVSLTTIGMYVGGYLLVGATWSIFKWWLRCRKVADKLRDKSITIQSCEFRNARSAVSVSENKGRLTFWIAYWPWSMLASLLKDTVEAVFNFLRRIFTSIANPANKLIDELESKSTTHGS